MTFDLFIALMFVMAFFVRSHHVLVWGYAVALGFVLEAYSTFLPGLAFLLPLAGLFVVRRLLKIFDASSSLSLVLTLVTSILFYAFFSVLAHVVSAGTDPIITEAFLRGGVFALRLLSATFGLVLFIWSVRYGISLVRYAFLE